MKKTTRTMVSAALLAGLVSSGCDGVPERDSVGSSTAATGMQEAASGDTLVDALRDRDPYARARNLGELLPTLDASAVPEIKRTLETLRLDLGAVEFELLIRFWATQEPAEATAWTFKHASPLYQLGAARTVIEIWAEADPAAAVIAVQQALAESNEEVVRVGQMALVQGWFKNDRQSLEGYIYGLGSGLERQRSIFGYALSLIAADGGEATIHWAEAIPESDARYKLEAYRQVMSALTWADMTNAMRFCDEHCEGPYGQGLRPVLIRTRLRNGEDGGGVMEWVASTPEGDKGQRSSRTHSLWVAYSTWAYRDRDAALAWMREKVQGAPEPWVVSLYGEFARQLAADSPEEAIHWGEQIEDESERELTLARVVKAWRAQDPEAAEAWLSQSSLSAQSLERAND